MAARPAPSSLRRVLLGADPARRAIYVFGMVPAVWYFYLGFTDQLGADPLNVLERGLGRWALRFLIAALAITPLRWLGGPSLIRYRRAVGLLGFYYAALHLSVYMVLDQGLDFAAIWADIVKRPYITVGMLAFIILVPLAVTSNNTMIRHLGAAAWQRLHRAVYVATAAAVIHYLMVVKTWPPEPVIYAVLVTVLLLFRVWLAVQKRLRRKAREPQPARAGT
jgi:sulfoxide reductase heme-binding subunit YedZ